MTKPNEQYRSEMTADELAVLDGKPIAETPEANAPEVEAEADEQPAAEAAPAAAEPAAEPAAEVVAEQPAAEVQPAPTLYDIPNDDFAAQRDAIKAERREVESKWSGGELSDDERVAALEAIQDKSDALLIAQTRAATLTEANAQAERKAVEQRVSLENAAMKALAEAEVANIAKKLPAIDYRTDTLAQTQFDMMFSAVKANPANAGLSAKEQVAEAHKAVRALRGMGQPAPVEPKPKPTIPQTLGNLPSAAAQPVGSDLAEQLEAIDDPDVLEAKWASLPANQRANMLRATLPSNGRRR